MFILNHHMNLPNQPFFSLQEVGTLIQRSGRTALRLIHDHQLKGHQLRKRWLVKREDLERFLKNLPSNF